MSALNQTTVTLIGAGGTPPYSFSIVTGAGTTIPASISGNILTVDATSLAAGTYAVEIQIKDQLNLVSTKSISIEVVDPGTFSILNRDTAFQPNVLPFSGSLPLSSIGGTGSVTYSLLDQVTTLPGVSVSGSNLLFTLSSFGEWTIGLRATDSVGQTTTRLFSLAIESASVVSVSDGYASIRVNPTGDEVGAHQFTLSVVDASSTLNRKTFNYTVDSAISSIDLPETSVNHVWTTQDLARVVYPIAGDLSGFVIGTTGAVIAANGLTATIDTTTNSLIVSGPPTSFGNAEVDLPIAILQGTRQVATVTRSFTLIAHDTSDPSQVGAMTCLTRPYIVGEMVGLNPQRPRSNSPSIFKNASYIVQLAEGDTLPRGLSLDARTGLIYGKVLAADVDTSTLEYVDSSGVVRGTIEVQWDIVASQFQIVNDQLGQGQLQAAYSGSIGSTSSASLTAVTLHRGSLPTGVGFAISSDGKSVTLTGTPETAGYFDIWIQVTNSNGQNAYYYKRLVFNYVTPLSILTDSLSRVLTNTAYSETLHAVGGVQPYQWTVVGGNLPTSISLNSSSGEISGTTMDESFNQNVTFQVTDARGVTATSVLPLAINNTLTITTPVLPVITAGVNYSYRVVAAGGTGGYVWTLGAGSAALPGGITLSSDGVLSGATSLTSFTANIIIQVTDSANNVASHTFALTIGSAFNLLIDTEGVGPIIRGAAYNGSLRVIGNGASPYTWSITPDSPNQLPAGFRLSTDTGSNGVTATLSGTTNSALLNDSIKVQVVDKNGNSAFAFLLLDTYSDLQIKTASLPQATVSGNYSAQLTATGYNPPFAWTLDPSSPALPAGLALNSSTGVISGVPTATADLNLVIRVTDALGDYATRTLRLISVVSTLAISTNSLPQGVAGRDYATQLVATGGAAPYTWSVSPNSKNLLPSGISLDPATGNLTGKTLEGGYSKQVTFRVTDSIGVYQEQVITVVFITGITLHAGPDYVQGTSYSSLGLIAAGDVGTIQENNLSFIVVATNVISASASGFSFGLPGGFNAAVINLSNGTAYFKLSGPFANGQLGDHQLNFSVSDSGVNASATFVWTVYSPNSISLVPLNSSLPQR